MSNTTNTNRVALITGASSGIGQACALRLAADGFAVVVGGRNADRAKAVVDEISAAGGTVTTALGDVAEPGYGEEAVATAVDTFGRLDVLVNAAGVITRADAEGTSDEEWHRIMSTNVDGLFRTSRAALPALRSAGGGAIVNISSTNGLVGAAGLAAYCASKGAVTNLTRAMALDHAAEGIRVNAVCPGPTETGMTEHILEDPELYESLRRRSALQRWAQPDEVAAVFDFLISPEASIVTGAVVPADGGISASTGQFLPEPIP